MMVYSLSEHLSAFPTLTLAQRQRLGVEPDGTPLDADGLIGPRTRSGVYLAPEHDHPLLEPAFIMSLAGAREDGGNNCGYFPYIFMGKHRYSSTDDQELHRGKPQGLWCAGFVSWCMRVAYDSSAPYSWSAKRITEEWAKGGQRVTLKDAQPGDVISWFREGGGHVGIVVGIYAGMLYTIEGNGKRKGGAVGVYGYKLGNQAMRGYQAVRLIARRVE